MSKKKGRDRVKRKKMGRHAVMQVQWQKDWQTGRKTSRQKGRERSFVGLSISSDS